MKRKTTLIRQKEIVLAARKLIVRLGSEHITVKRVAKEIGVSEAAIYRHFKSKKDVLSFLIDDIDLVLTEDIERSNPAGPDSLEVLENILLEHISGASQKRGVAFQVIAEIVSLGDKTLNKKVSQVIDEYMDKISAVIDSGVKSGRIRPDVNVSAAAMMFFSLAQGLVNVWALNQYKSDLEQAYKPLWQIFLQAIANSSYSQTA